MFLWYAATEKPEDPSIDWLRGHTLYALKNILITVIGLEALACVDS